MLISDDGRLLQISAGVKVSSKRLSTDGKPSEHDIFSTPLYVTLYSNSL